MKVAPLLACFIAGIASTLLVLSVVSPQPTMIAKRSSPTAHDEPKKLPTLADLTQMSDSELARQDIALVNLVCASGLPGAEQIDIPSLQKKIDDWASHVKTETDRHLYKFRQKPNDYKNSEPYFRMLMLGSVLQQDLGVIYNRERIREVDFSHSQDLFIHGVLGHGKGGTCLSLPVIMTAVSRRLGYPIKIVRAKAHLFCRWDDGKTKLNIEASSDGVNSFDDDYYKTWPHKISPEEIERGRYLTNLTPRQELADFLAARGHCLSENGHANDAIVSYSQAHQLDPQSYDFAMNLQTLVLEQVPLQSQQKFDVAQEFVNRHPQLFAHQLRPQQTTRSMYPPGYQQQPVIDTWGHAVPQNNTAFDPMFP